MTRDTLRLFLHQLNLAAHAARWEASSDGQLLDAYSGQGEEAAFAELMRRHGPMVLGVCRRVLGHSPDAEDAFQATFAALASKAAVLRRAPVGGWLHRVAVRAAGKLRHGAARRRIVLREARGLEPPKANRDASWEEVKPILDQELERLPHREHRLLVACYLEGKTHGQAAAEIGLPVGSVARHLGRARELLRRRLVRRGVALSAVLVEATLAGPASGTPVPAVLLVHTGAAAAALAAGAPRAMSTRVAALTHQALSTMTMSPARLLAVLVVCIALACTALWTCLAITAGSEPRPRAAGLAGAGGPLAAAGSDRWGDTLPPGALARLGTVRWRHGNFITFLAFVAGGKQLLTVGQDGIARRWEVRTGHEVRHFSLAAATGENPAVGGRGLTAGFGFISVVALSADGRALVTTCADGTFRVWDPAIGKELRQIKQAPERFTEIALSADGKTLAGLALDRTIELFDVASGKILRRLGNKREKRGGHVFLPTFDGSHLAFAPDGKTLVSAALGLDVPRTVALQVWDVATGKQIGFIEASKGPPGVAAPAFSPDGKLLAWRRGSGTIDLANAATGKVIRRFRGRGPERDHGMRFIFTPDGKTLVTRSPADLTCWVWDIASGKERRKFPGYSSGGFCWTSAYGSASEGMAVAPDSRLLAIASSSHSVHLLDLSTGKEVNGASGHTCGVAAVRYAPDGKTVLSCGEDGTLRVWETATGKELGGIELPELTRFPTLSADGRTLAVAHPDNRITLRDAATGKELRKLPATNGGTGALAFSPDGGTLAVEGLTRNRVAIWLYAVTTGKERRRITVPPPAPDSRGAFAGPASAITGMAFSPDGKTLACPISPYTLGLWDVASGRELLTIQAPNRRSIENAVFTADSRSLVLDFGDDRLSLWEVASGKERRRYGNKPRPDPDQPGDEHGPVVLGGALGGPTLLFMRSAPGIAVSPDGRLLAQARRGGVVGVWETATGKMVGRLKGHRGRVTALTFAPDGKTLASGSADTTTLIWDVAPLAPRRQPPARELSAREVEVCWADLAGDDAAKAYRANGALAAAPERALPFLRKHLQPTQPADAGKIRQLIAGLDAGKFAARQQASKQLEGAGELAIPLMKKALANRPPLEIRRRLEELIAKLSRWAPPAGALRHLRAVEALERMGTSEALTLLSRLARGAEGARLTDAAQAALRRSRR
jgi:RNA polymerase sigma factor (sigma-70 family)